VIIMAVPLSVLFSAGLITIALFAKSHKEAQSLHRATDVFGGDPGGGCNVAGGGLDAEIGNRTVIEC